MNKNKLLTLIVASLILLQVSCAQAPFKNGQLRWDLDHHLQFKQTQLGKQRYQITVVSDQKTHFSQLATFLLRKSFDLCQSYGFTLEILTGVESYNHKLESPNMIMPSLSANVQCPI